MERFRGAPILMMFFEPECGWCLRQFKVLDKVQEDCKGAVRPVAVGINGSRQELLSEHRRINPDIPTYQASSGLLGAIGGVPATPYTVIADNEGQPLGWLRGYVTEEQLRPLILEQLGATCST